MEKQRRMDQTFMKNEFVYFSRLNLLVQEKHFAKDVVNEDVDVLIFSLAFINDLVDGKMTRKTFGKGFDKK